MDETGKTIVYSLGFAQILAPFVIPGCLIGALVMKVKAVAAQRSEAFKAHALAHNSSCDEEKTVLCPSRIVAKHNKASSVCLKFSLMTFLCIVPVFGALVASRIKWLNE